MDAAARKRRRHGMGAFLIATFVVLGLVVVFFIVDSGVRSYAEGKVKQEIAANLPDSVTGDVAVSIGGLSVIAQYLTGNFEHIELRAPHLAVDGVAASVHIVATNVPLDQSKPVGDIRGIADLDQDALNALLQASLPGGSAPAKLVLGASQLTYTGSVTVLGIPIGYEATATPSAAADSILLTPSAARVTTSVGGVDASRFIPFILGQEPVRVCVAKFLPEGVNLSGVSVTPERARVTLESSTLMLSRKSLTTLGACTAG